MKILLAPVRERMFDFSGIRAQFPGIQFREVADADEALREIGDAQALFGHLDERQYLAAKKLRWVQSQGSGVDWMFSIPGLLADDIVVTNTKGAQSDTIAEHAMGLLLAMTRGFFGLFLDHAAHHWRRPLAKEPVALHGLTIGILGLGQIGRAVAERARAFHMRVLASDAETCDLPSSVERFYPVEDFRSMLAHCRVVVVTVPFTDRTKGMIGAGELRTMQPGGFLVAVSRGGVVDEEALMESLRSGRLSGAALDVQVQKPVPTDSPMWETPNLILTPHCAGESTLTVENTLKIFGDNIENFIAGRPLTNIVDKKKGY